MRINASSPRLVMLLFALLLSLPLPALAGAPAVGAAPPGCEVSGEAYGVNAVVDLPIPLPDINLPKTGLVTLPPGGTNTGAVATAIGISVAAQTNESTDTSTPTRASAESSSTIAGAGVNLLGLISADVIEVTSSSWGDGGTANSTGGSTITNLVVNGDPVTVAPNLAINLEVLNLVVGTVTIDERIPSGNGTTTSGLTVNALHVVLTAPVLGLPAGTDIVVGSATSNVECDAGALVPAITALNPAAVPAGSGNTVVTVQGVNFAPDAEVLVNGTPVTTGFIDGGQLTATIPAAMLTTPATLQITVRNSPDGTVSAPVPLQVVAPTPGQPTITVLTPSVILAGSGDTVVRVEGTNFAPGAEVLVNGTQVPTGFVDSGELTATIPSGMLATPGTLQITVQNPGGGTSAPAPLPVVSAVPGQLVTLTVETNGDGAVTLDPPGIQTGPTTFQFPLGTVVEVNAAPGANRTFIRWDFDGTNAGWADPADLTMDGDHTIAATFVQTPAFPDVPPGSAAHGAITELSARGIIRGYLDGNYGPGDGVQRAQMAALIARATPAGPGTPPTTLTPPDCLVAGTWDCEDWGNTFTDRNGLDGNLWRNVGTLQHYGVALGYTAQDCADQGKSSPCYGPTDPVTYAQTISFITRAMVAKGYWQPQPGAGAPAGVPAVHAADAATFTFYAGAIPAPPANWNGAATRGWFAQALWAALDSYWGTDGTLPDERAAGGFIP